MPKRFSKAGRAWRRRDVLAGAGVVGGSGSGWVVRSLIPAPGYVGALAVEGEGGGVRFWEWPEWAGEFLQA
jgi:hypothetical protein